MNRGHHMQSAALKASGWLQGRGRKGALQAAMHLSTLEAGAAAAGSWLGRGRCSRGGPIRALIPSTPARVASALRGGRLYRAVTCPVSLL